MGRDCKSLAIKPRKFESYPAHTQRRTTTSSILPSDNGTCMTSLAMNLNPIALNEIENDTQALVSYGKIITNKDGIVQVVGLDDVSVGEVISIGDDSIGMAINIENDAIKAIVNGDDSKIVQDNLAVPTGSLLYVPVGENLLGRVIDTLGYPMDSDEAVDYADFEYLEAKAPGIISRKSVHESMQTGILAIDSAVSVGRGQRELIIGDRQVGKTTIAIDTIINHRNIEADDAQKLYCIYVAVGQRLSSVVNIVEQLKSLNAFDFVTIVSATAADPAALQYLAPYTGCTVGEYYRDNQMHALVVYDDLSKHAVAYRQISLLLRRPPGREAYPGDVFYLHSRLLERASKLNEDYGAGSLTALPVIETQAGDLTAYIPTNVISITDGQIFLERELFYKGIRPAINIGLSVSRVGSAAQNPLMKEFVGSLKLELAQYREVEIFASFGGELDATTQQTIRRGSRLVELLKQAPFKPLRLTHQLTLLFAGRNGYLDALTLAQVEEFKDMIMDLFAVDQQAAAMENLYEMDDEITRDLTLDMILRDLVEDVTKASKELNHPMEKPRSPRVVQPFGFPVLWVYVPGRAPGQGDEFLLFLLAVAAVLLLARLLISRVDGCNECRASKATHAPAAEEDPQRSKNSVNVGLEPEFETLDDRLARLLLQQSLASVIDANKVRRRTKNLVVWEDWSGDAYRPAFIDGPQWMEWVARVRPGMLICTSNFAGILRGKPIYRCPPVNVGTAEVFPGARPWSLTNKSGFIDFLWARPPLDGTDYKTVHFSADKVSLEACKQEPLVPPSMQRGMPDAFFVLGVHYPGHHVVRFYQAHDPAVARGVKGAKSDGRDKAVPVRILFPGAAYAMLKRYEAKREEKARIDKAPEGRVPGSLATPDLPHAGHSSGFLALWAHVPDAALGQGDEFLLFLLAVAIILLLVRPFISRFEPANERRTTKEVHALAAEEDQNALGLPPSPGQKIPPTFFPPV